MGWLLPVAPLVASLVSVALVPLPLLGWAGALVLPTRLLLVSPLRVQAVFALAMLR